MKLTSENIAFINNYLKNSGVKYMDIRYEMTDHIATALESQNGNFNEAFKTYMLQYKTELLHSNKKFVKQAVRTALKAMAKNIIQLRFGVIFSIIFLMLLLFERFYTLETTAMAANIVTKLTIAAVCFYFARQRTSKKEKHSIVDTLIGSILFFLYCVVILLKPENWLEPGGMLFVYYSFLTAFAIEAVYTLKTLSKKYNFKFSN